ncbi:hypothetical protein C1879_10485 [Paraeggerthella hongkongensis]|uniref:5-methylcytosine restriction system specificity protein McrC n=1 Tax=Paraeggerthella sp. TaxID=2897350 RepID=UPI000DF785FE|nr:hypothetical protein C1879_10485 [Paraeggerthella hongkongensis]
MSLTAEDTVIIKNIWHMLAYAYKALDVVDYARIETEDFEELGDLLGAILAAGLDAQRLRGFEHGYVEAYEDLAGIRGRVDVPATMRHRLQKRSLASCTYDEYNVDTLKNRILKTAALRLLGSDDVKHDNKVRIKRNLLIMREVGTVDPVQVDWRRLRFHRNNRSYELLMGVCYLILNQQLATEDSGNTHFASFADNQQLHSLYEKFVLEYFRRHHRHLHASAKEIPRQASEGAPGFLPRLQTDIALTTENRTLIIDTKCYGRILKANAFGNEILSPAHLNQVESYVIHEQYGNPKKVDGMLLYALTDRDEERNEHWQEIGMDLYCYTLDLSREFKDIASQLDRIAECLDQQ